MSKGGRWIRLDTTWQESEWICEMSPLARLCWVNLLCYVYANGTNGCVRAMSVARAARVWDVPEEAVKEMLLAATATSITDSHVTERDVTAVTVTERDVTDDNESERDVTPPLVIDGHKWRLPNADNYKPDPTARQRQQRKRETDRDTDTSHVTERDVTVSHEPSVTSRYKTVQDSTVQTTTTKAVRKTLHATAPDDNLGEWLPTDKAYAFNPAYNGAVDVDLWSKRICPIQPRHHMSSLNVLTRLHNYFRLSEQQIHSMIAHVANDVDACKLWGTAAGPATWIKHDEKSAGGEYRWEKILAHMKRNGKAAPTVASARGSMPLIDPAPPPDPKCDCWGGMLENEFGERTPCLKCERGKFYAKDKATT